MAARRCDLRWVVAVLVVALAVAACGDGATTDVTSSPTGATSSVTPPSDSAGSPAASEPTTPVPSDVALIEVRDGRVVGDPPTIEASVGETVTFRVRSDVTDEVHIHGVDRHVDVEAGVEATVEFIAEIPGQFEIELEEAGLLLAELVVR